MRRAHRRAAIALVGLLAAAGLPTLPSRAAAQNTDGPDAPAALAKRMVASRVPGELRLDGRLDEPAWSQASFHSDFQQKGKDRGLPPRAQTSVAFLYDEQALYIGARMQRDGEGGSGSSAVGRRDDPGNADRILVSLDTFRDLRTAYTFGVSVGGVRIDYVSARDIETWINESFDPVWQARVASDSTGWTAEMRIPFSQLRFSRGVDQVWGVNVRRFNPATYLNSYWVAVPYYETGWASRFGEIRGITGIQGGAGMEITPYVLGQATYSGTPLGGDSPTRTRTRFGGDLKMGLGSSLTLDATVNPDFGQVEADPARVNLSAFETFFPERRPFFTEGTELFRVRGPNYFYSRRIGSIPPGAIPPSLFERVESATFLGGGKLTGRIGSGLGAGALVAVTDRERVEVSVDTTGATTSLAAAPRTVFLVGRAQQNLGASGSTLGVIGTAVERNFSSGDGLESILPRRAFAGGLDWTLRFGGRAYETTGYLGASRVSGDPAALRTLQASSAHYFQRPDADHVRLDSDLTEMQGWASGFRLAKVGGARWFWNAEVEARSPSFDIRDAGSQLRADLVDAKVGIVHQTRDGRGAMRDRTFGLSASSAWNFGHVRLQTSVSAYTFLAWANQWTTQIDGGVGLRALSDDLTRGGPLMGTPRAGWLNVGFSTSQVADASWNLRATAYADELGGWSNSFSGGWRMQASNRLALDFQAGVTRSDDSRQFVAVVPDFGAETFGNRYVFAKLERKEVFSTLRAKIAFAPDAVLTLYGQPFIATGRFHDFGELTAPRALTVRAYGADGTTAIERQEDGSWIVTDGDRQFEIEDYDFWVRSFRSTSVFQWEWRRGSTLYLIWQRTLSSFDDRVGATGATAFLDAFNDPGDNTFVVKVSVLFDVP